MSVPSVFISYARVDRARVAKIAAALSAAGHKVWWDAAIEVGSAFASDIARALDAADVVVVAWSAKSVTSGWVLDEAGSGRDRHRLVPLLLDGTPPPLGFRQLHGIDLAGGRERKAAVLAELVSVVERVAVSGTNDVHPASLLRKPFLARALPWLLGLAVAALVALIGWQWLAPQFGPPEKPVVAVMPFLDMSAAKGEAYFAEGLSEEILDTLALDARLKVLGRTTAWALRDKVGDPAYLRSKLGVTRLLEGSVRGGGSGSNDRVKVSVRLIDTADGTEIWSQVFDRSGANVLAVQEEVAAAVAAQLAGPAADGGRPQLADGNNLPPKVYENVLVARQLIRTRQVDALARARVLAEAAIAAAPDYAPAHAARSMATVLLTVYGDLPPEPALGEARAEAETAIRLDPRLSEGYTALGNTLISLNDPTGAIAALTRATKLRPNNSEARMLLGRVLMDNGQLSRAITELELAVASDPLWITPTVNLVRAYGLANQPGKIRALEASFRALSPDPADTELVASDAALATGDYARALQLADAALARNPKLTNAKSSRNNALLPLLGIDQIPLAQRIIWPDFYWQGVSGRWDDAATTLLRQGRATWDNSLDIYFLANALSRLDRQVELVASFDARFATIADYANSPAATPGGALLIASAMAASGRSADADALRGFARARMMRNEAGGLSPSWNAADWATLLLAEGNRPAAVAKLEAGLAQNWSDVCSGPLWVGDLWSLAPLRGYARFETVVDRCRVAVNKQRTRAGLAPADLK